MKIHKFEEAGLGKAPFRFKGVYRDVGPHVSYEGGVRREVGYPGQPMGVCAYCGQGIAECCLIVDAEGKQFIVGNVCVGKTGDRGLKVPAKDQLNLLRAQERIRKENEQINQAEAFLKIEDIKAALRGMPHPMGFKDRKTGNPLNALDWAWWMMANAGNTGRLKVYRLVKKVRKSIEEEAK